MPRGLSTAAKNYIGPFWWAVKITARDGTTYFFAEDDVTFLGQAYSKNLKWTDPLPLSRATDADGGGLMLLLDDALRATIETKAFNGARCEVKQLLLGIEELYEIGTYLLREPQFFPGLARFRMVSELNPSGFKVPFRSFSQECTWRFAKAECGYDRATLAVTENLAERTATSVQDDGITDSTLAMTVNEHANRELFVTEATTGRGQVIRVKSNTATALVFYGPWVTKPTGTVKFKVFTLAQGAPRPVTTSTAAKLVTTATGGAARYIEDTALALTADAFAGEWVKIFSGTGNGQIKRVGANTTGGRFTLDAAETDFAPVPDGTSVFGLLYDTCTFDYAACAARARIHRFNAFPTLVPPVTRVATPTSPGGSGGGSGGGGRHDDGRGRISLL